MKRIVECLDQLEEAGKVKRVLDGRDVATSAPARHIGRWPTYRNAAKRCSTGHHRRAKEKSMEKYRLAMWEFVLGSIATMIVGFTSDGRTTTAESP